MYGFNPISSAPISDIGTSIVKSQTASLDGVLLNKGTVVASFDGIIFKTLTKTASLNGILNTVAKTSLNAILSSHPVKTASLNALLQAKIAKTTSLNAVLKLPGGSGFFAMDAILIGVTHPRTLSLNAVLKHVEHAPHHRTIMVNK